MNSLNRRQTLQSLGGLAATTVVSAPALANYTPSAETLRLGVITDLHGGLAVDAASRLDAFLSAMKTEQPDALLQLGDFAYPNAKHQSYADQFNAAHPQTIHVIGNHEFDYGLKRADCYRAWGINAGYYQRDVGSLRILVLDGNETGSPTHRGGYPSYIGKQQQQWLARALKDSDKPVLILSHQPLAGTGAINNAAELQALIAKHRDQVVACLNGHTHVDTLLKIDGVAYLHLNSASYYWVGGKTRMAYYTKPLYTTVTIDPQNAAVRVEACQSAWKESSPEELGYFESPSRPAKSIVMPRISERAFRMSGAS